MSRGSCTSMADNNNDLLRYFSEIQARGIPIVRELPRFELDGYLQNYEGRTRFDRLILIGKCSVPLCVDALKMAIHEAKQEKDVGRYKEAWECIRIAAPNEPEAQRDDAWIEKQQRENKAETVRLEAELKGYRNNLIKESIRMGNEDLGNHFEEIGYLKEAAESYSRMRHDASTMKHIKDCSQHLISVHLQRRDWTSVLSNVTKITGVQNSEEKGMQPYLKVCTGVGLLGLGRYGDAANAFLHPDSTIPTNTFNDTASPNDIAIYGGLLSLATMDREQLQSRVLDNVAFRAWLEYEPHIRKAITLFINGRYANCLSILESHRADCMLDLYLQSHVPEVFRRIRTKCIVQYLRPFSCVTLESLDAAFARPGRSVLEELLCMIRNGDLKAKYDAKDKVLVAARLDPRQAMQQKALKVAHAYEKEAKERLRRINIIAAGLEVKGPKQTNATTDEWYGAETLEAPS